MRRTVNGRRGSERAATGVVRAPALEHPVASQNCSATCRSSWRLRTPNGLAHNVRREPSPPGACAVHCWCVALKRCAAESCSRAVASDQECVVGASPAAGCVPLPTLNGASTRDCARGSRRARAGPYFAPRPRKLPRGGQRKYSDVAIETALTLRFIFHLPLRQSEGFLTSLFRLMGALSI